MGGLEAFVASKSQLERTSRIDAEFFQKRFLKSAEIVATWDRDNIANLTDVSDGNHFTISRDFVSEGVPYYRGKDVTNLFFVESASPICITEEAYNRKYMRRSHIKKGDILLSIVGTIGQLSLVASCRPATCSCKLAILRPLLVSSELLAVFLRSEHGQNQIERFTRGAVQKGLILEDLDQIFVPKFSKHFENQIVKLVNLARDTSDQSGLKLREAEDALLAALGLANWTPPEPLSYTARASSAFVAGRLDPQYFMPAKEQVKRSLADLPGLLLGERYNSIRDMFVPSRAEPDLLVRNYDLTDALVPLLDAEKMPIRALEIGSVKKKFEDGDVAVSRLRAYLKEIAVVQKLGEIPVVGSSEFIALRPKDGPPGISAETLMVFLRSTPVQTILKWCQDGSQHPRFSEGDLLSIPVPDAVSDVSSLVTIIVQESFIARRNARNLLDNTKRAVEIAIEEDESAAIAFLNATQGTN